MLDKLSLFYIFFKKSQACYKSILACFLGDNLLIYRFFNSLKTPKNILLRGIKRTENVSGKETGLKKATDFLSIETTLQKLI